MKRAFLLLACTVMMTAKSFGYEFEKYPQVFFYQISPSAKWMATAVDGTAVMFNREDSVYYTFEGDGMDAVYDVGFGNAANDLGMIVGASSEYDPAYYQDGEWHVLPMPEGVTAGMYSMGHGVTPDGKYICGNVSTGNFGDADSRTTLFPALWTRSDDGSEFTCEILPYPAKDFSGRSPQYITALSISDDGATIAGQVVSNDGFTTTPIVYSKDSDGKWSYKEYGKDMVFDSSVDLPPYPTTEVEYPTTSDYMDEQAQADYLEAYYAYKDSVDLYNQDLIDKYPEYPNMSDYISDQEGYDAAMEAYQAYQDSVDAFESVYYDALTGSSFVYNTVMFSANGKYLAQSLQKEDPDSDPLDWQTSYLTHPIMFDLSNDGATTEVDHTDMCVCGIANDGMMVGAAPSVEYTRNAFIIEPGSTTPVKFDDWVAEKAPELADSIKENMAFDVESYVWNDETGEYDYVVVEDSIVTGSMVCTPDGKHFVTYLYNYWAQVEEDYGYFSYYFDITPGTGTGIKATATAAEPINLSVKDGKITVSGNGTSVEIYDMSGRIISNAASTSLTQGVYTVKATDNAGNTLTRKIYVKK